MKTSLKIEELGIFLLSLFLFTRLDLAWWWFPMLLFTPDIGMIGYAINPKVGAITYNLIHHRFVAAVVALYGLTLGGVYWQLAAIILFAHSSLDRALGYGLKYEDSFGNTHLGRIGKEESE